MAALIEFFQSLDETLIESIDSKIEPVLLLEAVKTSSINAWLNQ